MVQAPLYGYLNLSNSSTPFSTSRIFRTANSTITHAIPGSKQKNQITSTSPDPLPALPLRYSSAAVKHSTAQIAVLSQGSAIRNGPFSGTASSSRCSRSVRWSHLVTLSLADLLPDWSCRGSGVEEKRIRPADMRREVTPRILRSGEVGKVIMKGRAKSTGKTVKRVV
jgi:hypothetical protein